MNTRTELSVLHSIEKIQFYRIERAEFKRIVKIQFNKVVKHQAQLNAMLVLTRFTGKKVEKNDIWHQRLTTVIHNSAVALFSSEVSCIWQH